MKISKLETFSIKGLAYSSMLLLLTPNYIDKIEFVLTNKYLNLKDYFKLRKMDREINNCPFVKERFYRCCDECVGCGFE